MDLSDLLSDSDIEVLTEIGVGAPDNSSTQRNKLARSFAALVSTSFTVEHLAEVIGVSPSRIRQRLNHDRTIWGFKTGPRHQWRIPAWEVLDGRLLAGLEPLAKAIPLDMHPVAVERLVHTPNPDLVIDNEPVSVRDWLPAGNDAATPAAFVGDPARAG